MKIFRNCKIIKNGRKWVEVESSSNTYKTNMKISKDSMSDFKFVDGDDLVLNHIGNEFFENVTNETHIVKATNDDINKYFKNIINKKHINRFIVEYVKFKDKFQFSNNVDIKLTIKTIDNWLIENQSAKKIDLHRAMGKLDPNIQRETERKKAAIAARKLREEENKLKNNCNIDKSKGEAMLDELLSNI